MKIFRGTKESVTDSKLPSDYIKNWKPGKKIYLDGTIDKSGTKHTTIELEIEEDDVIALFNAQVNSYC